MLKTRGKGSGRTERGDQRSIRENEGEKDLKSLESMSFGDCDVSTARLLEQIILPCAH
jgi:hypothetical protein